MKQIALYFTDIKKTKALIRIQIDNAKAGLGNNCWHAIKSVFLKSKHPHTKYMDSVFLGSSYHLYFGGNK